MPLIKECTFLGLFPTYADMNDVGENFKNISSLFSDCHLFGYFPTPATINDVPEDFESLCFPAGGYTNVTYTRLGPHGKCNLKTCQLDETKFCADSIDIVCSADGTVYTNTCEARKQCVFNASSENCNVETETSISQKNGLSNVHNLIN